MEDPDEMRAVLALGVLAGMLALVQYWASQKGQSILSGIVQYPVCGGWLQNDLFTITLGAFTFFLFLLILAVGIEGIRKFGVRSRGIRTWARREFIASWAIAISLVAVVAARLVMGHFGISC